MANALAHGVGGPHDSRATSEAQAPRAPGASAPEPAAASLATGHMAERPLSGGQNRVPGGTAPASADGCGEVATTALAGRARAAVLRASEEAIQRALVDLLSHAARPGVAWTHMPAGEARHKGVAGKLKGMGVKAGWPDLLIAMGGRLYGLELKTALGRVSPAQQLAHAELTAAGAVIAVTYGLDQAVQQLKTWGVVR